MVRQVTQQCDLCLQTNLKNNPKLKMGRIGKGNGPEQQWQIDFTELPRKGGYRYLLVLTDTFQVGQKHSQPGRLKLEKCSLWHCKSTGISYSEWKRNQLRRKLEPNKYFELMLNNDVL